MKVNWIKGVIEPPEEGKYYVITEAQDDTALYNKGDIVIAFDRYSKTLGWLSFIVDDSTWKILAWAEILLPDVPEEVTDRLVTYFDTEVRTGGTNDEYRRNGVENGTRFLGLLLEN